MVRLNIFVANKRRKTGVGITKAKRLHYLSSQNKKLKKNSIRPRLFTYACEA